MNKRNHRKLDAERILLRLIGPVNRMINEGNSSCYIDYVLFIFCGKRLREHLNPKQFDVILQELMSETGGLQ